MTLEGLIIAQCLMDQRHNLFLGSKAAIAPGLTASLPSYAEN
jgi:hypothetical protein